MATRPPRLYVPLDVGFPDDPKVVGLTAETTLFYVFALISAKKRPNQCGWLSQLDLRYAANRKIKSVKKRTLELVEAGLLEPAEWHGEKGYQIASWTSWNMTETEADKRKRDKAAGGYVKAHRAGKHANAPVDNCPRCAASAGTNATASAGAHAGANALGREEKTSQRSSTSSRYEPTGAALERRPSGSITATPESHPGDYHPSGGFAPRDYVHDPDRPWEGGWVSPGAWIKPSVWRDGWGPHGLRPAAVGATIDELAARGER